MVALLRYKEPVYKLSSATVTYQCIWGPRYYNTVGPAVEGGPPDYRAAPLLITTLIRAGGRADIEQGLSAGPN